MAGMRLMVDVGYNKILFAEDCNITEVLKAFGGAQVVEETGPYNGKVYKVCSEGKDIGIKLIPGSDWMLPNNQDSTVDKLLSISKERDTLQSKVYQLEQQVKKAQEAVSPAKQN